MALFSCVHSHVAGGRGDLRLQTGGSHVSLLLYLGRRCHGGQIGWGRQVGRWGHGALLDELVGIRQLFSKLLQFGQTTTAVALVILWPLLGGHSTWIWLVVVGEALSLLLHHLIVLRLCC